MSRVILTVAALALLLTGSVKAGYGYAPAKKVYQPVKKVIVKKVVVKKVVVKKVKPAYTPAYKARGY